MVLVRLRFAQVHLKPRLSPMQFVKIQCAGSNASVFTLCFFDLCYHALCLTFHFHCVHYARTSFPKIQFLGMRCRRHVKNCTFHKCHTLYILLQTS